LRAFIHNIIAGVTGLANDRVRQAWQATPAPVLPIETDWAAFAVVQQSGDFDSYLSENDTGLTANVRRDEVVDVLCTFYGPNCQRSAALLSDGLQLSQNRAAMQSVGAGLVGFSPTVHAPELFNDRYIDRVDTTMTLRRQILRAYPILSFLAAYGDVETETESQQWVIDPQGVIP
jgi:hypothetical protein